MERLHFAKEVVKLSLTKEDILAIAGLIVPLETRMEAGFSSINERLEVLDTRMENIEHRMDDLDLRMGSVETRLDKLESDTASLKTGQLSLRRDIKILDQKVQDTYELALDAWGKSTENRMLIQEM